MKPSIHSFYTEISNIIKHLQDMQKAFEISPDTALRQLRLTEKELNHIFLHWSDISFRQCYALLHPKSLKHILNKPSNSNNGSTLFEPAPPPKTLLKKVHLHCFSPSDATLQQALPIYYHAFDSPFGDFFMAKNSYGICQLHFGDEQAKKSGLQQLKKQWTKATLIDSEQETTPLAQQIFTPNTASSPTPLCLVGTDFQLAVWQELLKIPEGELRTYGDLAAAIGQPKAAQAVGTAVGQNAVAYVVPCHRVINSTGKIGHFRWGSARKVAMLIWELKRYLLLDL